MDAETIHILVISASIVIAAMILAGAIRSKFRYLPEYDVVSVVPVMRDQIRRKVTLNLIGPNGQPLQVKIPSIVSHGDRIRLADEGFENKGDFYVLIKVII